jgi:hypothetical protein
MPVTLEADAPARNLFGRPASGEIFAGVAHPEAGADHAALGRIAEKIGRTRRPGAKSDIPAGVTYLTQFVVHDLDFPTRDTVPSGYMLDLGLIYGDGPKHDAFCYQVPAAAGATRHLLRIGRTRPTATSPAWGAARDLPRASCPHFDQRPAETRTDVLVPNSFSDSNLLLGQMQVLWALMHNAIAATLAETRSPEQAFDLARRINRGIYTAVIRRDLLGNWLMPAFRDRYAAAQPRRLSEAPLFRTPREFMAGVGRLGHGLVREIYSLNEQMDVAGLRSLVRHTSTGRPHDMPLTEEWLLDFSRFFAIGSSVPQRARALGPHVARPFATGSRVGTDGSDGLVLRDLVACSREGVRSVRSLIGCATRSEARLFEGCFAQDETTWTPAVADWLADTGLSEAEIGRLAADPPLTLFLMLEAEADTGGRSLGALGSVIMGETLTAALPAAVADPEADVARAIVFRDRTPGSMDEMIRFLQRHYRFADGARLHTSDDEAPSGAHASPSIPGGSPMLDTHTVARPPIPRIEVADYIEMGRLVAQWAADPATRPETVDELREQLDGIAVVPDRIKTVEIVQSTLDHLILRLPVKEMIEESLERVTDPMGDGTYPLPQFYADHYRPGFGPVLTPLDILLARVGDYTIAQCR